MLGKPILRNEILPLTGIRAAAAIWVVLYHMKSQLLLAYPTLSFLINPLVSNGYLGVDLFFILSGFVIHYNYWNRINLLRMSSVLEFLWMRLARLWPVHAVILTVFMFFLWIQHAIGIEPRNPTLYSGPDLIRNLLLVHSWAIPLKTSWNVPAWSISCEWLAYIFYPILTISGFRHMAARNSAAICAIILCATVLVLQVLKADGNTNFGMIRIIGEFTAGSFLCRIYRDKYACGWPWQYIVPLLIFTIFAGSYYVLPNFDLVPYWSLPLIGLVVLGLAYERCHVSRIFSSKPFLFGGYISYSFYMVHELILIVMQRANGYLSSRIIPIVDLAAVLVAAIILYKYVEEPSRKAMRKLFPLYAQRHRLS